MATYDFNLTRDQIITGALRILGVVSQGQTPDTEQITDAASNLNTLLKSWEVEGLPIWAIKKQSITLVDGTSSYTIGVSQTVNTAKPLKVYQAWLHDTTSNVDVPMTLLTQDEYNRLGNKTSEGFPVNFYYESLRSTGNLYLFPTPDSSAASSKTVVIQYQAPFEDFDSASDTPDVPQELLRALKYNLAADLAFEYGYPIKDRRDLFALAEQLKDEAFSFIQEEGSFFFKPDRRNY